MRTLNLDILTSTKQNVNGFLLGSQSASEGHRPPRQPSCPEWTTCDRAGAKCSEYEAAAGAAAEATAPGKSAEATSGDRNATENSQSQGTSGQYSREVKHNFLIKWYYLLNMLQIWKQICSSRCMFDCSNFSMKKWFNHSPFSQLIGCDLTLFNKWKSLLNVTPGVSMEYYSLFLFHHLIKY